KPFDYKFIEIKLSELKSHYYELFLPKTKIPVEDSVFTEVYENHLFGRDFPFSKRVIYMLVNNKPIKFEYIDNHYLGDDSWQLAGATQRFKEELIRKLRLFKEGDIYSPAQFTITDNERELFHFSYSSFQRVTNWRQYEIEDSELENLEIHLKKDLVSNDLTKIAETYFANSYEVNDFKIKFINLITALESLFNRSNNQISQILSRHLAVLISNDKESFQENYRRIKKLYGIRSKLVHGQTIETKESIENLVDEMYTLTRVALIKCMELNLTKDELFEELNSKGY
ncbi:MAG: hypothetical protein AAF688_15145, partial [Bacteroidota bacterium]